MQKQTHLGELMVTASYRLALRACVILRVAAQQSVWLQSNNWRKAQAPNPKAEDLLRNWLGACRT